MLYRNRVKQQSERTEENRLEGRSNVFLSAALDSGAKSTPVRIRNISSRGALVDGSPLPQVGTRVRLFRGSLSAAGELAWAGEGQCGVNFDREIDVARWVQRIGHAEQQRVNGVIAALRNSSPVPNELQHEMRGESLPVISAALDQVCERLAKVPGAAVELGEELLKLDTIAQSLRRLATGRAY